MRYGFRAEMFKGSRCPKCQKADKYSENITEQFVRSVSVESLPPEWKCHTHGVCNIQCQKIKVTIDRSCGYCNFHGRSVMKSFRIFGEDYPFTAPRTGYTGGYESGR